MLDWVLCPYDLIDYSLRIRNVCDWLQEKTIRNIRLPSVIDPSADFYSGVKPLIWCIITLTIDYCQEAVMSCSLCLIAQQESRCESLLFYIFQATKPLEFLFASQMSVVAWCLYHLDVNELDAPVSCIIWHSHSLLWAHVTKRRSPRRWEAWWLGYLTPENKTWLIVLCGIVFASLPCCYLQHILMFKLLFMKTAE